MHLVTQQTLQLSGAVTPPSSKSQNIRALLFALLAKGTSHLENVLDSTDTRDAIQVCQTLGAVIVQREKTLQLTSAGLPLISTSAEINTGNSGITTRFSLPLLGYRLNCLTPVIFDCGEQMRARPISPLVDPLRNLGMNIKYLGKPDSFPLEISGALRGGKTSVNGYSQYLTALLMALPCAPENSEITAVDVQERPYVEMTLNWLLEQNIKFNHHISGKSDVFQITGGQTYRPFHKAITGDFSSASYLIAAGVLLGKTVELSGLDMNDPQGDKRLVEILRTMGADIEYVESKLIIKGGKKLHGICIDANDIPDLLPTLAVVGCQASGKTALINVKQARTKETDRIHSMTEGLKALGAYVEEHSDGMVIYQSALTGNKVKGYGDHRTVMALALAGLLAEGTTTIDDAEAIGKTFPNYVELMQELGAKMEIVV